MRGQDLTQGNIPRQIWSLAWPIMLSFLFQTLYNFVDAFWVGRLTEEAIPAVSISQISLFIMISLGLGITVGSGVLMSMNIGRKNKPEAERILGQAFVLAAVIAVFFTVAAFVFKDPLLTASGAGGSIFPLAKDYFEVISAGSIFIFLLIVIVFAFNAQGDNKTVTVLFSISSLVNLVLDPLLIFGAFGIPGMGIRGAAVATIVSQALMLAAGIKLLSSPKMMVQFRWKNLTAKWQSVRAVLKIGFPAAITQVLNPILFAALTQIIMIRFLEAGSVGFSVGFRIENFAFLPGIGFSSAAMAMVGQNTGARNILRARLSHRKAQLFAFLAGSAVGLAAIVFARGIVSMLSITDPLSTEYALSYLVSVPFTYGVFAMTFVNVSTLQATGKSWPGFFIYLTQTTVIVVGSLVAANVLGAPIWSIWIVFIAGRLLTLGISQIAITSRFSALEKEFQQVSHGSSEVLPEPQSLNKSTERDEDRDRELVGASD